VANAWRGPVVLCSFPFFPITLPVNFERLTVHPAAEEMNGGPLHIRVNHSFLQPQSANSSYRNSQTRREIMSEDTKKKPDLFAYTVTEGGDKAYFDKIGVAWANKKGGFNVRLSALPVGGEIVLLPLKSDGQDAA
jgi:hypothetical protein